jgi:hypothetical protein
MGRIANLPCRWPGRLATRPTPFRRVPKRSGGEFAGNFERCYNSSNLLPTILNSRCKMLAKSSGTRYIGVISRQSCDEMLASSPNRRQRREQPTTVPRVRMNVLLLAPVPPAVIRRTGVRLRFFLGGWPLQRKRTKYYGTFDQSGDIWEWTESVYVSGGSSRVVRGGSWDYDYGNLWSSIRNGDSPTNVLYDIGFRVASVPEPGGISLIVACAVGFGTWRMRRRLALYTFSLLPSRTPA